MFIGCKYHIPIGILPKYLERTDPSYMRYRYICSFLILSLSPARAQTPPGQISGVVKDPDQAVITGSTITLTNHQTKAKSATKTDAQGAYSFRGLPPGDYVVEAQAPGFTQLASPDLKVADQPVTYDFSLTIAGASSTST